jgi:hypothetical protein
MKQGVLMSLFRRLRERFGGRAARLHQLKQDAQSLMERLHLTGHCDCLLTHDADDQPGCLLIVQAHQIIPVEERELFQQYFRRKLTPADEAGDAPPLMVIVRDGDDVSRALNPPAHVGFARLASIVAAANEGAGGGSQLAARLAEMRRQMAASRRQRPDEHEGDDAYAPTQQLVTTGAGALL